MGPGDDEEGLGGSPRRDMRRRQGRRHPRDPEGKRLHRIPTAERDGGEDGAGHPRPDPLRPTPISGILQVDKGLLQGGHGDPCGHPRDHRMAAGEERGHVPEVRSRRGPGRSPQHISLHRRRPGGGDPVQEEDRERPDRTHAPVHGTGRTVRGDRGGGGTPAGVLQAEELPRRRARIRTGTGGLRGRKRTQDAQRPRDHRGERPRTGGLPPLHSAPARIPLGGQGRPREVGPARPGTVSRRTPISTRPSTPS